MRYAIYFFEGYDYAPTFEKALEVARLHVKAHYKQTQTLGESFAFIFDKLNHYRWIMFKVSSGETRYKQVY